MKWFITFIILGALAAFVLILRNDNQTQTSGGQDTDVEQILSEDKNRPESYKGAITKTYNNLQGAVDSAKEAVQNSSR